MNFLIGILITLVVFALIFYIVELLLGWLGVGPKVVQLVRIIMVLFLLLWLVEGHRYYGNIYHS